MARIADDGIAVVEGLLVTTATRTVVVVATMVPFESAVVTGEFRDHRWEVARWTWDDLSRPRVVGERVRRPFVLGRR